MINTPNSLHIHEKLFCGVKSELGRCLLCAATISCNIAVMILYGRNFLIVLEWTILTNLFKIKVTNSKQNVNARTFQNFFLCPKFKTRHKNTFS